MNYIILFLVGAVSVFADTVDIISSFEIDTFPEECLNFKNDYPHRYYIGSNPNSYFRENYHQIGQIRKILIFDASLIETKILNKYPKEKLILFNFEPINFPLSFYDLFSRIYTWDETLIDNKKFFRVEHPYLRAMDVDLPPFEERKLCTLISGNWTKQRKGMVEFFETKPLGAFDCYGNRNIPKEIANSKVYKGGIPGFHSGDEKISVLKMYRFSICFENIPDLHGYITEKIFSCFAAGCVPVYWGPSNIEDYIPKECFIDYRDFEDNEELYEYISTMSKEEHEQYLEHIRVFLKSDEAQPFSSTAFDRIMHEAIES